MQRLASTEWHGSPVVHSRADDLGDAGSDHAGERGSVVDSRGYELLAESDFSIWF